MLEPSYLSLLPSGELDRRAAALEAMLAACRVCPRLCGADRLRGAMGACRSGRLPVVASSAPHFGEEPVLSGTCLPRGEARGAGNVFLGGCNLRCVYCQNGQISQGDLPGREVGIEPLARILLGLQARGCHDIGFVSPTHFAPQIVRAAALAARLGLRLPLVYNTNAYDSVETLRLLDGVFDIFLPDLRYSDDAPAAEYSGAPLYRERSRAAVREMYRQVGDGLVLDGRGLLRRGLVVRLLILPGGIAGIRQTLEWIRDALSPRVAVSVMSQYFPTHEVGGGRHPTLDRRITEREYEEVVGWLDDLGFENGWIQPFGEAAPEYYRPDFRDPEEPFRDARDFGARAV